MREIFFERNVLREITTTHAQSIKKLLFLHYYIICFKIFKREFMEKRLSMLLATLFLCIGMVLAQTKVSGVVTSAEDGSVEKYWGGFLVS